MYRVTNLSSSFNVLIVTMYQIILLVIKYSILLLYSIIFYGQLMEIIYKSTNRESKCTRNALDLKVIACLWHIQEPIAEVKISYHLAQPLVGKVVEMLCACSNIDHISKNVREGIAVLDICHQKNPIFCVWCTRGWPETISSFYFFILVGNVPDMSQTCPQDGDMS